MFRHEGPSRSPRKNMQLAGYLALVAGYVNSGGFILIGSFTSHVTGNIGRLGNDLALGQPSAALFAAFMVLAFFAGGVLSSIILERAAKVDIAQAYGVALAVEAALLCAFIFAAGIGRATHPRILDAEAAMLSAAMGVQNALVTRLSGAVVRTTHLTGAVTDLSIEVARWYVRRRSRNSEAPPSRKRGEPSWSKGLLLIVIIVAFVVGAMLGAVLTFRTSRWAMLAPVFAVSLASVVAFRSRPGE